MSRLFCAVRSNCRNLVRSLAANLLVIAILLLAGLQTATSQTSTNKTEFTPDKTLKSSARINPTTLAMEFSIPLPSYPGRAGAGLPNAISYSSKVWGTSVPSIYSNTWGNHEQITAQYAKGSWAGWTSSLGVPQIDTTVEAYRYDGYSWTYDPTGLSDPDPSEDYNIVYVKKMRVIMPDGSVHELRADDGYHAYGTAINPGGVSNADFYAGTFLSVDGSRMRLEFTDSTFGSNILYMPGPGNYGNLNLGKTGKDLVAPGSPQAAKMSYWDYDSAIGGRARVVRDWWVGERARDPRKPHHYTARPHTRVCCR